VKGTLRLSSLALGSYRLPGLDVIQCRRFRQSGIGAVVAVLPSYVAAAYGTATHNLVITSVVAAFVLRQDRGFSGDFEHRGTPCCAGDASERPKRLRARGDAAPLTIPQVIRIGKGRADLTCGKRRPLPERVTRRCMPRNSRCLFGVDAVRPGKQNQSGAMQCQNTP
jgi:hypothetical protein